MWKRENFSLSSLYVLQLTTKLVNIFTHPHKDWTEKNPEHVIVRTNDIYFAFCVHIQMGKFKKDTFSVMVDKLWADIATKILQLSSILYAKGKNVLGIAPFSNHFQK